MSDVSTHRLVIETIHKNWHDGTPFAIWEVRDRAKVSSSSVSRNLKDLIVLKFVVHSKKGFAGRKYRVSARWPNTVKQAVDDFEFAKIVEIT